MKFIPIGQVVAAHGIRGEIKFRYYNESAEASLQYRSFFVDDKGVMRELKPLRLRSQKGLFVIKFTGLETLENARTLLGRELFVRESDLAPLGADEYYDYQLIGLEAITEQERKVGTVVDVMHTNASDILVIAGAAEVLVPMTEAHILGVSMEKGIVRVAEDGLVE